MKYYCWTAGVIRNENEKHTIMLGMRGILYLVMFRERCHDLYMIRWEVVINNQMWVWREQILYFVCAWNWYKTPSLRAVFSPRPSGAIQVFIDQRIKLSQVWGLASQYSEKSRNHENSILQSVLKVRSHPCAPTPRPVSVLSRCRDRKLSVSL